VLLYDDISDRHADTEELLQGRSNIVVESFDHRQNTERYPKAVRAISRLGIFAVI